MPSLLASSRWLIRFTALWWLCGGAVVAMAQNATDSLPLVLSLADALQMAKTHNPTFLQTVAARRSASAQLRSARGGLLPQLGASIGGIYQQGGQQIVSGEALGASSNALESNYNISLTYQLNANTLMSPGYARANLHAADADITADAETLRSNVTQQYVTVLEAQARADLNDSLVVQAQSQLDLAKARLSVGSGTDLDVKKATVTFGQQQVSAIQAHNQVDIEKLHLFQLLGISPTTGVQLTTSFTLAPPIFSLDSILTLAHRVNPHVNSLRAHLHAAQIDVHRARGLYLPTLTISTGIGGYAFQYTDANYLVQQEVTAQQESYTLCTLLGGTASTCGSSTLTSAQIAEIRNSNKQFPFRFTTAPKQIAVGLTLPIFDGFVREQNIEEAAVGRLDATYQLQAQELQLTTDVTSDYLSLQAAAKTAALQADNAAQARDALTLAEERYRVGSGAFLDVTDARATYQRAENDHISAVYDYYKAFAALESAVGQPLRSGL